MNVALGFLFGIVASGIAACFYEYATQPLLKIFIDNLRRAQGQIDNCPPDEFYHLKVQNVPSKLPLLGRRPAWSCKATLDIFNADGSRTIQNPIEVRWTSQPEPLIPVVDSGHPGRMIDPARLVAARKIDVHRHEDQRIPIAIKYEGEEDCYIFSNESYSFQKGQNPDWRLGTGVYRIRLTVYYERGCLSEDFEFGNSGPSRDDVYIRPWQS